MNHTSITVGGGVEMRATVRNHEPFELAGHVYPARAIASICLGDDTLTMDLEHAEQLHVVLGAAIEIYRASAS